MPFRSRWKTALRANASGRCSRPTASGEGEREITP
jgi:hypothetical protein